MRDETTQNGYFAGKFVGVIDDTLLWEAIIWDTLSVIYNENLENVNTLQSEPFIKFSHQTKLRTYKNKILKIIKESGSSIKMDKSIIYKFSFLDKNYIYYRPARNGKIDVTKVKETLDNYNNNSQSD